MRRRQFLTGIAGAATALAAGALAGCSGGGAPRTTTTLRYQGQTGQVTFPELAADLGLLGPVRLEWIGNFTSGPQDIQAAVTGDTDYGGAFNGGVLRLAAAGAPIRSVIGYYGTDRETFGGFYVPEDSPIRGARDLVGRTVGMNTLGAHWEDTLRIWLQRSGLSSDEIAEVQPVVVPPVATESALRSGQLDVAALHMVYRDKALARGGLRPLTTDLELFGTFTAGSTVMREEFIAANPDTVRAFVGGTARAVAWAQTRPRDEVVARFKDIIRRRGRNESLTTVDYWHSTGVALPGGLMARSEFTTWLDLLEADGIVAPGRVDVDRVVTNAFNPYAAEAGPVGAR